jgi:hypothetical protein
MAWISLKFYALCVRRIPNAFLEKQHSLIRLFPLILKVVYVLFDNAIVDALSSSSRIRRVTDRQNVWKNHLGFSFCESVLRMICDFSFCA